MSKLEDLFKSGKIKIVERKKPTAEEIKAKEEEAEKKYQTALAKYNKEKAKEEKRIKNLPCPCCKSINKQHILKHKSNGVMGAGYHAYVTDDYWVCEGCGVHYSDINKPEKELQIPVKQDYISYFY